MTRRMRRVVHVLTHPKVPPFLGPAWWHQPLHRNNPVPRRSRAPKSRTKTPSATEPTAIRKTEPRIDSRSRARTAPQQLAVLGLPPRTPEHRTYIRGGWIWRRTSQEFPKN